MSHQHNSHMHTYYIQWKLTNIRQWDSHRQHPSEAHSMRHHSSVVSHMVLHGRHEWYLLHSQQLPLIHSPCLSCPCNRYLSLLHQHVIKIRIHPLIHSLHILDHLWRNGGHVCVESMGIELRATYIMRRGTVHRGKMMVSSPFPSPFSARISILVRHGHPSENVMHHGPCPKWYECNVTPLRNEVQELEK
jgi:hypothetical protein